MVDKSDKLVQLMRRVRPSWTPPPPLADASLFEQGMLCVLSRKLTATQAQATVKALRHAYPDWNILRVSQIREFREHVKSKSDETALAAARELKNYLQEIYQKNHGFDIEWMREDEANAGKFVLELEVLGGAAGHHLLYLANPDMLPVTQGIIRVLDRVGAMNRTTSLRKARAALQPFVPQNRTSDFAVCFGEVVDRWCDSRGPRCWKCPLVEVCTFGKRVFRAWKNQQKRLAVQRKREAARLEFLRKKDLERRKRDEGRERKRREAEERQRAREAARRAREEERRKKTEAERRLKERDAKQAAEAAAAKKKAAAAARKKKPAKKKPAVKKPAKKKPARKKPVVKKPARKTPVTVKPAHGKSRTRARAAKKKAARRR